MPIRLNLFCNGVLRKEAHEKWEENFDQIDFRDAPNRDEFGIIIKEAENHEAD